MLTEIFEYLDPRKEARHYWKHRFKGMILTFLSLNPKLLAPRSAKCGAARNHPSRQEPGTCYEGGIRVSDYAFIQDARSPR